MTSNVFEYAPDYIEVNGNVYEKLGPKDASVNIELDLDEDVLKRVEELVSSGKFVNKQEAIRASIREAISRSDVSFLEKTTKKNRKGRSNKK